MSWTKSTLPIPLPMLLARRSIRRPLHHPTRTTQILSSRLQHTTPRDSKKNTDPDTADPHVKNAAWQDWKGTRTEDHAVNRAAKNDITDPETEGSAKMRKEHDENEGIADSTLSSATTRRDTAKGREAAEKEFPEAPGPVIGMEDERGSVSFSFFFFLSFLSRLLWNCVGTDVV